MRKMSESGDDSIFARGITKSFNAEMIFLILIPLLKGHAHIREARRGDVCLVSPRLFMYGLASRGGATTIQSYKNGGVSCRDEYSLGCALQWLALASEYHVILAREETRSCFLPPRLVYVCMVTLWTYCTIWHAMPRGTASPRLSWPTSTLLHSCPPRGIASPRLAYVCMPL